MSYPETPLQAAFPRPGRVLKVVMLGIFGVWLAFAIAINWADAPASLFQALCGNTERILHGEVWRIFTAPWLHMPTQTLGHVLSALMGLYFLAPSLEERWGSARFARFLFVSALIAYGTQMVAELVLPHSIRARLVDDYWFGAIPVVEAIAIAWALSFRGQVVRLFFVLPVSSTGLIVFVIAASLMYIVIGERGPAGAIAPFGGMLAGWLFGGSTPSPFRRLWLKLRLAQLDAEARREARDRRKRVERSDLRVISGGKKTDRENGSGDRFLN
ncbi:MAG TPA: rhomboid family intramembrane serine protease [Polyangiaceae bacterium]|nr:rhomboid family intramembrane serine protease [Polyangiaceae bacterium]